MIKIPATILAAFCLTIMFCSCNNYGDKASKGNIEVYYKDGISAEMATQTANFLADIEKLSNGTGVQKSFQLQKKQDTICLRMVTEKEKLGSVTDDNFYIMANLLSDSLYNNAPVNIELTDNRFNTFRTLNFVKMNLDSLK